MKTATVYGFTGEGATVKDAKADAVRQIETQHEGYWTPKVYVWRNWVGFIFRDLDGWNYCLQWGEAEAPPYNMPCCHRRSGGLEAARDSMLNHMAQNAFDPNGFQETDEPPILKDASERTRKEFKSWAAWQFRYAEARKNGGDDERCRSYAGGLEPKWW